MSNTAYTAGMIQFRGAWSKTGKELPSSRATMRASAFVTIRFPRKAAKTVTPKTTNDAIIGNQDDRPMIKVK